MEGPSAPVSPSQPASSRCASLSSPSPLPRAGWGELGGLPPSVPDSLRVAPRPTLPPRPSPLPWSVVVVASVVAAVSGFVVGLLAPSPVPVAAGSSPLAGSGVSTDVGGPVASVVERYVKRLGDARPAAAAKLRCDRSLAAARRDAALVPFSSRSSWRVEVFAPVQTASVLVETRSGPGEVRLRASGSRWCVAHVSR